MLNIPDSVKALFKLDNVKKNFRVQFPNGEFSDLTNNDIVLDSVSFTESICSTEIFRFGLAELSVIEFETVGIGDMRGMTIQCSCEICIDSLTTAQKNEIKSYNGDGEYYQKPAATAQGWEYYRVPYGVFVVSECPRNQQAAQHRRVTAYSPDFVSMNPFEAAKLRTVQDLPDDGDGDPPHYTPDAALLPFAQLAQYGDEILLQEGFTRESYKSYTESPGQAAFPTYVFTVNGTQIALHVESAGFFGISCAGESIYGVTGAEKVSYTEWETQIENYITELGITFPASVYVREKNVYAAFFSLDEFMQTFVSSRFWVGGTYYGTRNEYITTPFFRTFAYAVRAANVRSESVPLNASSTKMICVYGGGRNDNSWATDILFPKEVSISAINVSTQVPIKYLTLSKYSYDITGFAKFWKYTAPSGLTLYGTRLDFTGSPARNGGFDYVGAYDMSALVNGYLEIRAEFAAPKRTGGVKVFRLERSEPAESLPPSLYANAWWDEFIRRDIGMVRYTVQENNTDYPAEVRFGNALGVYSMEDNAMLKTLQLTQSEIGDLIYTNFALYAVGLSLNDTEVEDAQGLPYVEAGDLLLLTAEDGETANLYITRQKISGEMFLHTDIQEVGNTVNERTEVTI